MADNQFINFNSQDVADMYRRNQYARMLQDQAAAPIEPYSYKGIQAPIQPTQIAAKMAAALLAGHQQNQMDERYANEKAAAEQKMTAEQERRRGEVADYQKGFEPTLSAGPSGGAGDYGTPPTISTPRSRGEILAQALRGAGSDNPQVANMGRMQYEQQNAMAQDEARAARDEITRQDMLAGRAQAQSNADRSFKQSELASERTYNLQKSNTQNVKEKPLPTPVAQKLLENQNNLYNVRKALALTQGHTVDDVEGDASATGYKGFLPNAVLQRVDPQGVATRAEIANIGSMIIHDRSGAAVTAAETPRLMPFIPTATDDEGAVQTKLKRFVNEYERIQNETKDYFTESGFKVPNLASAMPKIKYKEDSAANKGATVSNWNK
jgi:hypothetical protein